MLWDLIRDFFVQHIFGGTMSDGETLISGFVGSIFRFNASENAYNSDTTWTDTLTFPIGDCGNDNAWTGVYPTYISMGDWFSTTATIISISIIVVLCCLFIYKIIKLIGGLIR